MSKKITIRVPGFRAGAVAAGVRYSGRLDLGLILAERPCPAAGLFTQNRVQAPSVVLGRKRLRNGLAQAVLANSGNANACVGPQGMADTLSLTRDLAKLAGIRPANVLMNSTGVIGEPLPAPRIRAALPALLMSLRPDGFPDFVRAVMTTDTRLKLAGRRLTLARKPITIAAGVKGAGMIQPNLATMLAYVLTDAALAPAELRSLLARAAADSFNALTVDGDTSTNDSIVMMASGAAGVAVNSASALRAFGDALDELCLELAAAMARDGEGATRMFKVLVEAAATKTEADRVARRVANSPLVKTAFHAADPNWGRLMAALGSAGVKLDPGRVEIFFEDQTRKAPVVKKGARAPDYSESKARKILSGPEFTVRIGLGRGRERRAVLTCDFSADYVKINADYRS